MAKAIVDSEDKPHPLEAWRRLGAFFDPQGLGTEIDEQKRIMWPERVKSVSAILPAIQAWKDGLARLANRYGRSPLPDQASIMLAMMQIVPANLHNEVDAKLGDFKSSQGLERHILDSATRRGNDLGDNAVNSLGSEELDYIELEKIYNARS